MRRVPEIDPAEAAKRAAGPDAAFLLDVREPYEWEAGHIADATHIPLADLDGNLDVLPDGRTVIVVCRSGVRSAQAAALLLRKGRDAHNLTGGMRAWEACGLPMVADGDLDPAVV